jgi:uncharacterized integral membrane protein
MHRRGFLLLLALYVGIGVWYALAVPAGEGVDELQHLKYAIFLRDELRLPEQDVAAGRIDTAMGHHPPLYYALAAAIIAPIDTSDLTSALRPNPHFVWDPTGSRGWNVMLPNPDDRPPWSGTLLALHLLRFFGIALGGLSLFFTYRTLRRLIPDYPWAAVGGVAFVGLNPAFLYMVATVHHDILVACLFTVGLFWAVDKMGRSVLPSHLVVVGLLVSGAVLTKISGALLAPIIGLALLLRPRREGDWAGPLAQISLVAGVVLAGAGWWFVRNQMLYGDLLGIGEYQQVFAANMRQGPFTWGLFVEEFLVQLAATFWGAFGFMHIYLPEWVRSVAWVVTGVALLGWIGHGARSIRDQRWPSRSTWAAWIVLISALVLIFAFYVQVAVSTRGAGHGRYFFPAMTAVAGLAVAGLNGYLNWRGSVAITLLIAVAGTTYAVAAPARYVWPLYELTPAPTQAELARIDALNVGFDGGVTLIGAAADSQIVLPGQGLTVTTLWAAQTDAERYDDVYVNLLLVSEAGELLGSAAFWPEISTTPAVWGERTILNRQSFFIPPDLPSGNVKVQVQVSAFQGGPLLAVLPVDGGDPVTTVTVAELLGLGAVQAVDPADLPEARRAETFAGSLHLAGAALPERVPVGGVLPVALYWEIVAPVAADYTIFVHVLDGADTIVAQLDRPPGGGTSPTSAWQPGQFWQDTYPVPLPEAVTPGVYRVRLGIYTWPDITVQPITVEGMPAGETVILGQFEVVP